MVLELGLFPIFEDIRTTELNMLKKHVQVTRYTEGTIVHFEGDTCEYLEMIQQGNIHIEQINIEGNTKRIRDYGAGSIFGLNILFSTNPSYLMHVIATKDTLIARLHRKYVSQLLQGSDSFRIKFIQLLSDNSKMLGMKMKIQFRVSLREKILAYITHQRIKQNSDTVLFETSKTELAMIFGVERTSLSRTLQKMKNEGLIEYDRKSICLLS